MLRDMEEAGYLSSIREKERESFKYSGGVETETGTKKNRKERHLGKQQHLCMFYFGDVCNIYMLYI